MDDGKFRLDVNIGLVSLNLGGWKFMKLINNQMKNN